MKYINIIESFYPSLSKQEKKVADYILEEKGKISYQSLQEIGRKINVGEATIVRFVKKIGFNGFQDLKINIAKEDFPMIETTYEDYIDNIEANINNTIANTKLLIDRKQLDKSINLIAKAERLFLYGVGSSGLAVQELQNKLLRFGKIALSYTDTHFQVMSAAVTGKNDVVIAVTLSGETPDILETLTVGRETLIDGGSLIAKMSQLYIIDVLCTGYALQNKDESLKMKHNTAEAVVRKNSGG